MSRIVALWAAAVLLTACRATRAETPLVQALPAACRGPASQVAQERCAGELHALMGDGPALGYDDPALLGYVQSVADRVAQVAGPLRHPPTLHLMEGSVPHAYATVGGHIFVGRSALARLDSEAELAALLGHEIAHVAAGHIAAATDEPPDALHVTRRGDELQADQLAVVFLRDAGYRPRAVVSMLERLTIQEEHEADHPARSRRIATASILADGAGETGRARYLKAIEGLVVGPDPRRGAVVDGSFVSVLSELAVTLPDIGSIDETPPSMTLRAEDDSWETRLAPMNPFWARSALAGTGRSGHVARLRTRSGHLARVVWKRSEGRFVGFAVVDGTADARLLVATRGLDRQTSERVMQSILDGVRQPTSEEMSRLEPRRLELAVAPGRGRVEDLVAQLCLDPPTTTAMRPSDPSQMLESGELVVCVGGAREAPSP